MPPRRSPAVAEEQLSAAVRNLIVSVEAYPQLQSNQNFLELQRELTDTEDRIAAGRRFYNANVRNYNTKVDSFPSIAGKTCALSRGPTLSVHANVTLVPSGCLAR